LQRAENREQRAESREQRSEMRDQRAERKEQRAESRKGREQRDATRQPFAMRGTIWLRKGGRKREEREGEKSG
jgi:hypothetical protein